MSGPGHTKSGLIDFHITRWLVMWKEKKSQQSNFLITIWLVIRWKVVILPIMKAKLAEISLFQINWKRRRLVSFGKYNIVRDSLPIVLFPEEKNGRDWSFLKGIKLAETPSYTFKTVSDNNFFLFDHGCFLFLIQFKNMIY